MKWAVVIVGVCAALVAAAFWYHPAMAPARRTVNVTIGSTTVVAEVADTDATREQGLSGRASLPEGQGMLFVFQQPGDYGFWMKDMNFPLDMLFANASGTIVTIQENALPSTYNAANPRASVVFYPSAPALYVLEVPAGFAAAHDIKEGSVLSF
jgi:uncharacterized membrane protein (UPF0127 family)